VNDEPRWQPVPFRHFGVAGPASAKETAFVKQFGACCPVDRAIDTAAAEQTRIGGVDYGVDPEGCDVGFNRLEVRLHASEMG
jgi:hypothetical protein